MTSFVLLLALAAQPPGLRSLRGTVLDASGAPVSGAAVKLKNTATLDIRSQVTKGDGKYLFTMLLEEIDYEVWAVHKELSSKVVRLSWFDKDKDAVINLKLDRPRTALQNDVGADRKGRAAGPSDRDRMEVAAICGR